MEVSSHDYTAAPTPYMHDVSHYLVTVCPASLGNRLDHFLDSCDTVLGGDHYQVSTPPTSSLSALILPTTAIVPHALALPYDVRDIVQTSRESNVPGWMLLPIIGCLTVGSIFLFSPSSVISGSSESTNSQWVGVLYIVGVRI